MICLSEKHFEPARQKHHVEEVKMQVAASESELLARLSDLRKAVTEEKLDWYIVPSEDEHQSEEIGESDERRSWISGFTGSAGTALIPSSRLEGEKAILFADSRYWVQAEKQVPKEGWDVAKVGFGGGGRAGVANGWIDWIAKLDGSLRFGIDPKLIPLRTAQSLQSRLASTSTQLVSVQKNLIDIIRPIPTRSLDPIVPHPLYYSGEATSSKLARIRAELGKNSPGNWIYVLPTLPPIAWLLNIRCPSDIPYCPVAYSYLVLTQERCILFVDKRKVTEQLAKLFEDDKVETRPYGVEEVGKAVKELVGAFRSSNEKKSVRLVGPPECSWALGYACKPDGLEIIQCPVIFAKAVKNQTEQRGYRNAYTRDGRAMVKWMSWLEKSVNSEEGVGEWDAAQKLLEFRKQEKFFMGLAYGDISGSGPNAALPHYSPEKGKDRLIDPDSTYVIDSGGQYLDGTIDTTRTLYFGKKPSDDIKRAYTRVLQAHMGVARAVFPKGLDADKLVMLGKAPLYQDGLDFGHGLGHSIGSYLEVHEFPLFPHGFSFAPGHLTAVEPGFYKEGEFGIRTESVYLCKSVETKYEFGGNQWLRWDRITQVPIMTNVVDWSLMSKDEIRWLNEHNTAVQETLLPYLVRDSDKEVRDWLKRVCKPKKIWPWTGA